MYRGYVDIRKQEQVLVNLHPSTVTVKQSVIQKLTGVNKNIAVSVTKVTCVQ